MASLQDQLLKAGMVDKGKAQRIKKEKQKQRKKGKGQETADQAKQLAEQARLEKLQRDQEINRQQQEQAREKAIQAQIRQLINDNRVDHSQGEVAYPFTFGSKIKKLYVTSDQQEDLGRGRLAIVCFADQFELVPAAVAEKIAERDSACVVAINKKSEGSADDDPYADYQIPDDLMW